MVGTRETCQAVNTEVKCNIQKITSTDLLLEIVTKLKIRDDLIGTQLFSIIPQLSSRIKGIET